MNLDKDDRFMIMIWSLLTIGIIICIWTCIKTNNERKEYQQSVINKMETNQKIIIVDGTMIDNDIISHALNNGYTDTSPYNDRERNTDRIFIKEK